MEVQFDDVTGGERLLREIGEEDLVHDACTCDPNRTFLFARLMCCHDDAAPHAFGPHRNLRTVVEAAHHLAFWTLVGLIWGEVQARLDERMIEDAVLFAASHKRETSEIGEHGSRAILPVESEQRVLREELVRCEIATDSCQSLAQFLAVASVPSVAETAEPLVVVRLANGRAGADYLPPLASPVARRTYVLQSAKGWGQLVALG